MPSKPYFDRGTWRMKWWGGADRGWITVALCKHPEKMPKGRKPKRPPAEAILIARKYADLETQARHGVDVAPLRAHDLREHLTAYLDRFRRARAASSVPVLSRAVRLFLEHAQTEGVSTLEAIGPKHCKSYLDWRSRTVAHATMKSERGLLAKVWSDAMADGIIRTNPWLGAKVPGRKSMDPPPYWTEEELQRLIGACRGWLKDFVIVAANTGIRASALLSMEWRDVIWDRNVIVVRQVNDKGGRGYQVPMTASASTALARRHATSDPDNPLVFPGPRSGKVMRHKLPYEAVIKAARRAKLPDKGHWLHILRHTFATHAVMRGVPLITVSAWLGHSSIQMTERYTHIIPLESQRQIERFDLPPSDLET